MTHSNQIGFQSDQICAVRAGRGAADMVLQKKGHGFVQLFFQET